MMKKIKKHLIIFTILIFILSIIVSGGIVVNLITPINDEAKIADRVIVLGAGLNGSTVSDRLKLRLNKTFELFHETQSLIILSGGQGIDENISEAQAMEQYLIEKGISKKRMILEDKSTSTVENLIYSIQIINQFPQKTTKVLIVSSDYHVFRIKLITKVLGIDSTIIGCKSERKNLIINILREIPATYKSMIEVFIKSIKI